MAATGTDEMVLRKTITVACDVERAFRLFTEGIGSWWPLDTHVVDRGRARGAVLEPRVGGALYERWPEGRAVWGEVLAWEPPQRVRFSWHPGREADEATEVEVRFRAEGERTRVELEHRGWEALGERAAGVYERYDGGWDYVLGERYAGAATGAGAGT